MKVFCLEFYHLIGVSVMEELQRRHGIQPILWTSSHLLEKPVAEKFPDCVFLHGGDAKMGIWPGPLRWCEHGPFDEACQHVWNQWHHQIADLFRRWDFADDYPMHEMSEDFYEQLVAWNHFLTTTKPDFIFLWEPPHVQYSLMLYSLARYYQIPVLWVISNMGAFSTISDDLSGGTRWLNGLRLATWEQQHGFQTGTEDLHEEITAVFARATNQSYAEGMPWWQRNYLQLKSGSINFLFIHKMWRMLSGHLKRDLKRLRKGLDKEAGSPVQGIYPHKERHHRVKDSFVGRFVWLRYGWSQVRNYLATMKHERAYNALVFKDVPRGTKYVLVCLAFQPELTSNPFGGIFLHQWLMANIVAHSVPEGYEVWIKEHPAQFVSLGGTSSYRNTHYYQLLARLPRVRLVPLNADQFDLIDNSLAIATLTGTVGFESMARGKPVLIFGSVWYSRCQMAYKIRSLKDCRAAMQQILSRQPGEGVPLLLLLKELELGAFRFGAEASLVGGATASTDENINDMSDHVGRYLNLTVPSDPKTACLRELLNDES
ncbi:MAG: hypothetical protein ACKVY0_05750 [Prosthecobacter sp.]|uniref:capsular polysaccharide export protein, LipB/KpsS family n=1 Tax=Prosthecobacter sp. TaxID=1965333 RepID=UPI0039019014